MSINIKIGQLVKSKIHNNGLTTWRVLDVYETSSGKIKIWAEAAHDTKTKLGFDSVKHEFDLFEIEEL